MNDYRERQYEEYLRFVEDKRFHFAPKIGTSATNLALTPLTLGIFEASEPRHDYSPELATPRTAERVARPMAEVAVLRTMIEPTPAPRYTGYAEAA